MEGRSGGARVNSLCCGTIQLLSVALTGDLEQQMENSDDSLTWYFCVKC